jgi:hypothetical protein
MLAEAEAEALAEYGTGEHVAVIVTARDKWHPGIVGLIAARLKDHARRPAFAIAFNAVGSRARDRAAPSPASTWAARARGGGRGPSRQGRRPCHGGRHHRRAGAARRPARLLRVPGVGRGLAPARRRDAADRRGTVGGRRDPGPARSPGEGRSLRFGPSAAGLRPAAPPHRRRARGRHRVIFAYGIEVGGRGDACAAMAFRSVGNARSANPHGPHRRTKRSTSPGRSRPTTGMACALGAVPYRRPISRESGGLRYSGDDHVCGGASTPCRCGPW